MCKCLIYLSFSRILLRVFMFEFSRWLCYKLSNIADKQNIISSFIVY